MTTPKTLEQLRAEKERAETQLAQEQHKIERLENRKKYLEKGERTKRTHRLCNLGGTVESLAPEIKDLTRTEMTELMEHIFSLSEVQRAVRHMAITHISQANRYAEHWEEMQAENIGCLFWGNVGNGKSYLAGCIANALMEKEVPVYMTNFAVILGDLSPGFTGRNEYISRLCRYPLLIIDDFGMERGTDYGLEQVFHVIDTRYRSNKPLIATTNRPLDELKKPTDTAHSRIYDRLLSMCVPIRFTGVNFRQETAKRKMETMKKLLAE